MVIETGEKKLICIGVHASCQSKVSPGPQAPHFESHPPETGPFSHLRETPLAFVPILAKHIAFHSELGGKDFAAPRLISQTSLK